MIEKIYKLIQNKEVVDMIISNKVKCLLCNDIIESTHRHDFKWCSCKNVAVDGGKSYLKRTYKLDEYEELSECID